MTGFSKRKYGLVFALVSLLLGLPFIHYHPDNSHTHASELSAHTHKGHFHSNELNGLVQLIDHASNGPTQNDHHPHPDTDSDSNTIEVNLQKSNHNSVKFLKTIKSGIIRKSFFIPKPTSFHPISYSDSSFESSVLTSPSRERSPPFPIV